MVDDHSRSKLEHRTFIPNNRSNSGAADTSRVQQDLSASPHQSSPIENECSMHFPVVRRAAGKVPHVCVIGAGVAGLRCADVLLQHGFKVTILEGRGRVGGRVCQSDTLGHLVDLGPNWIHGTNKNPILDLARETETKVMSWDGRQAIFDYLGSPLPEKEAAENTEHVWAIIEKAMELSNRDSASIPSGKSLFDFFQEQVIEKFPAEGEYDTEAIKKQRTVLEMAEMWGAFVGSPIQQQSLKFFWLEECLDGENLFVAETHHKILAKIAEPALHAMVKLGHVVKKVVSKEKAQGGEYPCVTVDIDGKASEVFDEVVMTAPLGWLKRNKDVFTPPIPKRLETAIDSISYGHLDKVYISFPTAFWNECPAQMDISSATPHDSCHSNVTATTAPLHQDQNRDTLTSNPGPVHWPGFTHWAAPSYTNETNPLHWNQEAVNLAALPSPTAHPTLLFYTHGPTSIHIAQLLTSQPESEHHNLLSAFFHPYFSRLPHYTANNAAHQPTAILATAWANDPLAGYGSYCNFQVGLEQADDDISVMRAGMPQRGVWLAGEHTAPFVALGTVTGAYWSGEGVAQRIARAYGREAVGGRSG